MSQIKFVSVFDTHGLYIDEGFSKAFFKYISHFKPQLRVHGGDALDLPHIMEKKDVSSMDYSTKKDFDKGLSFLNEYRPHVYTLGNHEDRIIKLIGSRNEIFNDYGQMLWQKIESFKKKQKVKVLDYDFRKGWHTVGDLAFGHGYGSSANKTNLTKCVLQTGCSVMIGHFHSPETYPIAYRKRAYISGCGADIDKMKYASKHPAIATWENSFYIGSINTRKNTHVAYECKYIDGKIVGPKDIML